VDFINRQDSQKYDLMKVALAHHRFGWIHPFGTGNGRVVRLLTYALLIKYGFNVSAGGRLLNPTAVFCNDRERYYEMLAAADQGTPDGLEKWCEYVLSGVLDEMTKVDKLTDFTYLKRHILFPALEYARGRELITLQEAEILSAAVTDGVVRSGDLAKVMPTLNGNQRTYQIKKLVEQKMLQPTHEGARQYTAGFANNNLIRGVIKALTDQGFIPDRLARP
jgi:Fic family protein